MNPISAEARADLGLVALPDDVVVLPGHGEQTSIGRERATNPFLLDLAGDGVAGRATRGL